MYNNKEYIYKNVSGKWQQINPAAGDSVKALADHLTELQITIDDDCQFCRIVRYNGNNKQIIEYRSYGGKVRINIIYV